MINQDEIKVLERQIAPVVNKTTALVIAGPKDMEKASDMRSSLKGYMKEVKEKKESVTKPMNEALKAARALFEPLENKLNSALSNIDDAMISYQTEEKRKTDLEAERIAKDLQEGKIKKVSTAMKKMDEIEKPDNKVGKTYFKPTPVFKVIDVSKLPVDYILADEVKIRQAMLAGIKLPGVEYTIEQRPVNSRS